MLYKAFISYSHGTDYGFAEALEAALQRFALPANGQPAIRLFRDASNLSATPELWPTIQEALEGAEFLLLIASEESAKSRWVNQEVEYWRAHGQPRPFVGVVAAFQEELAPYELSKGTIRFPLTEPVPVKLIGRMAKFRAKEIVEQRTAEAAK